MLVRSAGTGEVGFTPWRGCLQEPYQNTRIPLSEDVSAQTAFVAEEEEEESDGEDSALSHPKPLQRTTTRFYDAGGARTHQQGPCLTGCPGMSYRDVHSDDQPQLAKRSQTHVKGRSYTVLALARFPL
jgi:hypothetical protein